MISGFIKNEAELEEKISSTPIGIEVSIKELGGKVDSLSKSSILGIVGAFGVGKSTLIEGVRTLSNSEKEIWIHFDAWQFPERKELWDGLILETAKHLGKLENTRRSLEGEKNKDKKLAIDATTKSAGIIGGIVSFGLSAIFQPALDLLGDTFKYFLDETPAKRVFQMQDVFKELLNEIKTNKVVFVLEDIDRSGQDGLFFLETFRQFLSNSDINKTIIAVVPVSNDSYYSNLDTYLKCIDYVEFYNKSLASEAFNTFIGNLYQETQDYEPRLLAEFISSIYREYSDMTLRKLKLILRQANINYIELTKLGYQPNPLICIAIQASKYIIIDGQSKKTRFQEWCYDNQIKNGGSIVRFIFATSKSIKSKQIFDYNGTLLPIEVIEFVKRDNPENTTGSPSNPYFVSEFNSHDDKNHWYLPDFYVREL